MSIFPAFTILKCSCAIPKYRFALRSETPAELSKTSDELSANFHMQRMLVVDLLVHLLAFSITRSLRSLEEAVLLSFWSMF